MRSVMEHSFSNVPRADIQRSSFNRGHGLKTSLDADWIVPVLIDDVVPGDTFNVNMNFFARLATPLFPIMDNMYLESFFFFVPYRLVWDNWKKMHGEQLDPASSIDFTVPVLTTAGGGFGTGSLQDYFGFPRGNITDNSVSNLPGRCYNLIWNEWFRDQNLQNSVLVDTDNGPDAFGSYSLLKRGKRHDYFTSCLPWPQKGDAVSLPLGTTAPLIAGVAAGATEIQMYRSDGPTVAETVRIGAGGAFGTIAGNDTSAPNVFADLSSAASATINDLRLAFQTQKLLERDARSGTRYNELILGHFGVTVPDFRVQRPEFLGGGSSPVNVNPVFSTTI